MGRHVWHEIYWNIYFPGKKMTKRINIRQDFLLNTKKFELRIKKKKNFV